MSNVDEIIKLKELLDKNIITKEEFEIKKGQLLQNIDKDKDDKQNNHSKNKSKNRKGCLTVIFIFIIIFIIGIATLSTPNISIKNLLMDSYHLSKEEAENVINVINDCGYSKYYSNFSLEKSIDNEEIPRFYRI